MQNARVKGEFSALWNRNKPTGLPSWRLGTAYILLPLKPKLRLRLNRKYNVNNGNEFGTWSVRFLSELALLKHTSNRLKSTMAVQETKLLGSDVFDSREHAIAKSC